MDALFGTLGLIIIVGAVVGVLVVIADILPIDRPDKERD